MLSVFRQHVRTSHFSIFASYRHLLSQIYNSRQLDSIGKLFRLHTNVPLKLLYLSNTNMKFNAAILFIAASTCSAFVPKANMQRAASSRLLMQDTAQAVQAAMAASEKFGKTSPQARSAWELVEEMDAANR